jgi:pimeloyl-ACP methyl ester carboxylesterase
MGHPYRYGGSLVEFDIEVRSHRLHAEQFGSPSAPLVIGLHGLSGNLKHLKFLGERLGGDDLQLVAIDLRGRGKSQTTPPGSYGWESHALDVLSIAEALGFDRFGVIGQSMGGSVAMKVAEIDAPRLTAVVLVDIAGRVDPGVGPAISAVTAQLDQTYDSVESYLAAMKALGVIEPWSDYWDRAYRYGLAEEGGRFQMLANHAAVSEDRAYTATQDPYERWKHLTMPTLLLRATRELRPGAGYVVPADDRDLFVRTVEGSSVVEVDANHLTINTDTATADAIQNFLVP